MPYFPLLVKISSDANFSSALADGYDIRFTDSNGTTLLPYERESWSGGKGSAATANFWVRVPTVLHSASTTIYVYYGNSADSDWTATTSTITNCTSITNAQCTWKEGATQNYLAVWHMKEAGTPATWNDSTANAINGTNYGATATTGQVNGGGSFVATGSNYFITPILPTVTAGITEEAWVKPNAAGGVIFSELGQAGINYGWHDSHLEVETNNTVKVCMWANSETCAVAGSGITYGQWYHMVMRYNTTGPELTGFINGVKGATNGSTKQYPGSLFYGIGATDITNGGDGSYFSGLLDEERISKVTRTDGWIKFEYCNQTIDTTNCDTGTNPYEISLASQESSASIFSIKGQMRVKGVMRIK